MIIFKFYFFNFCIIFGPIWPWAWPWAWPRAGPGPGPGPGPGLWQGLGWVKGPRSTKIDFLLKNADFGQFWPFSPYLQAATAVKSKVNPTIISIGARRTATLCTWVIPCEHAGFWHGTYSAVNATFCFFGVRLFLFMLLFLCKNVSWLTIFVVYKNIQLPNSAGMVEICRKSCRAAYTRSKPLVGEAIQVWIYWLHSWWDFGARGVWWSLRILVEWGCL